MLLAVALPFVVVLAAAAWWIERQRDSEESASGPVFVAGRGGGRLEDIVEHMEPRSGGGDPSRVSSELASRMQVVAVRLDANEPLRHRAAVRPTDHQLEEPTWLGIGDAYEGVYPPAVLREVGRFSVQLDWRGERFRLQVPRDGVEEGDLADESIEGEDSSNDVLPEVLIDEELTVVVTEAERAVLSEDYERLLREDVIFGTYRNPRTRQVEGLRLERLNGDSLPARRGFREGDVIRAIDDFPVRSQAAALDYLRNLQGRGVSVLVLRNGRHQRFMFRLD